MAPPFPPIDLDIENERLAITVYLPFLIVPTQTIDLGIGSFTLPDPFGLRLGWQRYGALVFLPIPEDVPSIDDIKTTIDAILGTRVFPAIDDVRSLVAGVREDLQSRLTNVRRDLTDFVDQQVAQAIDTAERLTDDVRADLRAAEQTLRQAIDQAVAGVRQDLTETRQSLLREIAGQVGQARQDLVDDVQAVRGDVQTLSDDVDDRLAQLRRDVFDTLPPWATTSDLSILLDSVLSAAEANVKPSVLRRLRGLGDAVLELALSDETKERLRE